jgi:hypothetical protein
LGVGATIALTNFTLIDGKMVHAVKDCDHLIDKLDLEIKPGATKPAP